MLNPVDPNRSYLALVLGRAGLDLYPQPDGGKTRDADSFSADMGGSAGLIAVAIARAGASVGLISGLSTDAVGDFVRKRLQQAGVDTSLITTTSGGERTSLALAEVRSDDCEVVIYRNNPADLAFQITDDTRAAITQTNNLVITGTCLIDEVSRRNTLDLMQLARDNHCTVWMDLDYRAWNWPNAEVTRKVYSEAASLTDVLVGNEEEFAVLTDNLTDFIDKSTASGKIILLKRGSAGSSLFIDKRRLDSGIYAVDALKPYGSGDAFLGNLIVALAEEQDWLKAVETGSAAAAIVVATRGCASAMPSPDQINLLRQDLMLTPASTWR